MAVRDIGAEVSAWALDEAGKLCLSEDFGVDVSWSAQPVQTPQGVQVIPGWVLLITARNPVLGEGALVHLVPVGTSAPEEAAVRAEVGKGMKMLRDLAASKLAGINGGVPVPHAPGRR